MGREESAAEDRFSSELIIILVHLHVYIYVVDIVDLSIYAF
jgi:hypothetical protein